jgi:hypothetical protein
MSMIGRKSDAIEELTILRDDRLKNTPFFLRFFAV